MAKGGTVLKKNVGISIRETAVFAMFGAIIFLSKLITEAAPNVHFIGMFIVALTLVYRAKALYPIYVFVFLTGLLNGFALWWIPYLYIWAVLWLCAMLIPKNLSDRALLFVCPVVCSLHGFLYGTLYAPAHALMFGLSFKAMLAWIAAGFPYDCIHGVSNLLTGFLILPLVKVIRRGNKLIF